MKRYLILLFASVLLFPTQFFGQKGIQTAPELRKFSQQGWKIQHAHFSFDSLSIYFSAREPGKPDYDLYITRSQSGIWANPERLNDSINTASDELWPSIASDERRIFFIRRTRDEKLIKSSHGTQGITDQLFVAENIRGEWQQAEPSMIASNSDLSPLVMPDNQTIIYARKEVEKKRSYYALFFTRYIGYGDWTIPVRVDSLERRSLYAPHLNQLGDTVLQVIEAQEVERDRKDFDTLYINRQVVIPRSMRSAKYGRRLPIS